MKFKSPQSFDDIIKYYRYGYNLFEFCSGRQNINTEVRLYEKNIDQHIVVDLNEQFDDYAQDDLDYTQVIRFLQLGGKITSLFKLLNEEETKPNLLFLPDRNKLKHMIKYTDITDLCNSLDGEYRKNNIESVKFDRQKAEKLRTELYSFIDAQLEYPAMIKVKAKNLLGPLKNFSPSLKEKIILLVDMFFNASRKITQIQGHDLAGVTFYTKESFDDMIGKFVDIRNKGAHVGIAWNEGTNIFPHLKLYVYYSILKRAGYSLVESTNILRYFLSRYF